MARTKQPDTQTSKHLGEQTFDITSGKPPSAALKRIKATFVDHILWTKFNLRLLWEGKTLQDWVQEEIAKLNKTPLSKFRPIPESERTRVLPSQLPRKHWVPVRVDPEEYRKARWRWSAMGVSMSEWFYKRIVDYCADVDLDAIEKALTSGRTRGAGEEAEVEVEGGTAERSRLRVVRGRKRT